VTVTQKIKRVPARAVHYPDGRIRGLVLADADWQWLQLKLGERVIVEMVTEYQQRRMDLGYEKHNIDVAAGEVVIDDGEKLVRCRGIDQSDLRHKLFVRRPR